MNITREDNSGLYVAQLWHEILMKSSTTEEIEKYKSLMERSPIEIRIILIAGENHNQLLREYISQLNIPKSTLTCIIDRLEKKDYLQRTINPRDRRSFGLELAEKGRQFFQDYMSYQNDIGNRILNGLDEQEKKHLINLLTKIASYMIQE